MLFVDPATGRVQVQRLRQERLDDSTFEDAVRSWGGR